MRMVKKKFVVFSIGVIIMIFSLSFISLHKAAKDIVNTLESGKQEEALLLIQKSNKRILQTRPNAFTKLSTALEESYNYPTFFYICKTGTPEMVEECVRKGVNINLVDNETRETALLMALSGNNPDRYDNACILIDSGADVHSYQSDGDSVQYRCVHIFMEDEQEQSLDILKKTGDIVNGKRYRTVLGEAAQYNNRKVIDYLIGDKGISIDQVSDDGSSALHSAVVAFNPDGCKYLVDKGIDCRIKNREGKTALDIATELYEEIETENKNGGMYMYEYYSDAIKKIIEILE